MKLSLSRSEAATLINALQNHMTTLKTDAESVKNNPRLFDDFQKQISELSTILDKLETEFDA